MPINGINHSPGPLALDPNPKHGGESRDLWLDPAARTAGADQHSSPQRDRVEISLEARSLLSRSNAGVGGQSDVGQIDGATGEIMAERMQRVLKRLRDGFYDHPRVQGQVAEQLLPDIQPTLP